MNTKHTARFSQVAAIFACLVLGGCATKAIHVKEVVVAEPSVNAMNELKAISIEARDEMRLIAKAQQSMKSATLTKEQHMQEFFQATYIPPGFETLVDFSYVGQLGKAAEAVSLIAGYKLLEPNGVKPNDDMWVNINLKNRPLYEAIKEIGMQSGDKVEFRIQPSAKLIRMIYK